MDEKNHQMTHRRMVARREILRNHGRNNNSAATAFPQDQEHGPRPEFLKKIRRVVAFM
jgi:hypothetical protein